MDYENKSVAIKFGSNNEFAFKLSKVAFGEWVRLL